MSRSRCITFQTTHMAQFIVTSSKPQHYGKKSCTTAKIIPITSKFYVFFPQKNFERQKKIVTYLLSLDVWHLVRQICALRHCQFRSFHVYIACETSTFAIFSPSSVSLLFKGKFPKVLWEKGTSKRKKELGSDLVSCPLV